MNTSIGKWRRGPPPAGHTPLYTLTEAADLLGVSLESLRRLLTPYAVKPVAVRGRKKRFRLADLQAAHETKTALKEATNA